MYRPLRTYFILFAIGLFGGMLLSPPAHAQDPVGVLDRRPPSPTAASLGQYGEVPISHFTGTPSVSIPLTSVRGAILEVPVTLRYHGSGIRVADVPSWVGAGWSLDAGGVITRVVRSLPDDSEPGYFTTGSNITEDIWAQAQFASSGYIDGSHSAFRHYLEQVDSKAVDPEPDMYYFNFMGQSGSFVENHAGEIITAPRSSLRIERAATAIETNPAAPSPADVTDQSIARWTITTPDGVRYTFGADGQGSYHGVEYSVKEATISTAGQHSCEEYCTWASAWYLTRIESPEGDVIELEYSFPVTSDWTYQPSREFDLEYLYRVSVNGGCEYSGNQRSKTKDVILVATPQLIAINGLNHRVTFEASVRDASFFAPGELILDAVHEWSLDNPSAPELIRTFHLSYFGSQEESAFGGRLFLKEVQEVGIDDVEQPPHRLFYETGMGNLPSDPSSLAVDHWGYFNGAGNSHGLPAVRYWHPWQQQWRTVNGDDRGATDAMLAGSLKRIEYPTGGATVLAMEPHRYPDVSLVDVDQVSVSAMTSDSLDEIIVDTVTVTVAQNQHLQYTLSASFLLELEANGDPIQFPGCDGPCAQARVLDSANTVLASAYVHYSDNGFAEGLLEGVPSGIYTLETRVVKPPGYNPNAPNHPGEYIAGGTLIVKESESVDVKAGGLRVKAVQHYDGDDIVSSVEYEYNSPFLKKRPVYTHHGIDAHDPIVSCTWRYRQNSPIYSLGSISGSSVVYGEVVETSIDSGGSHGRVVREYTIVLVPQETEVFPALWAYSAETSFDYLFGHEKEIRTYDKNNNLINSISRVQGREGEEEAAYARAIAARMLHRQFSNMGNVPMLNVPYSHFHRYRVIGEWLFLYQEEVTTYDVVE